MDTEDVVVPGARDVRGTLDTPDADAAVVACPPHPEFGGNRRDRRLKAVADALGERTVATLRFDYGEWDHGRGEQTDAERALDWARERYDSVAIFGYSFGAMIALRTAAAGGGSTEGAGPPVAVSALAPDAKAVDALDDLACPLQVLYGTRDDTVDWEPVVERARELQDEGRPIEVTEWSADHHFVGQHDDVGAAVADFLAPRL